MGYKKTWTPKPGDFLKEIHTSPNKELGMGAVNLVMMDGRTLTMAFHKDKLGKTIEALQRLHGQL